MQYGPVKAGSDDLRPVGLGLVAIAEAILTVGREHEYAAHGRPLPPVESPSE